MTGTRVLFLLVLTMVWTLIAFAIVIGALSQ